MRFFTRSAPRASGDPFSCRKAISRRQSRSTPGSCDERRQQGWTSPIPLLVLIGAEDVWTPLAPCKTFLDGAIGRGARIEMQIYPGAYHGFDRANSPRRELPEYRTAAGVVPIVGTEPAARQDALSRVPDFLGRFLMN